MKIDSHQHFWKFDPGKNAWIPDEMAVIRKDFFPEDLQPVLEKNQISGCVAVQAAPTEEETQFLLNLAEEYDFIKGVVGWVDFSKPDVADRLAHFIKNPRFKGIRHMLQSKPADFMLNEDFLNGMAVFEDFNLTYDLLVVENQLREAIELVEKFPNQKFVLDHLAKPNISRGVSSEWKNLISDLATNQNIHCKISGILTETENFYWKPEDFQPFLEFVFETFGENRLMFGSDWPVCLPAGNYGDTISIVENFLQDKNEIVLEKVMGKNASKFYQL